MDSFWERRDLAKPYVLDNYPVIFPNSPLQIKPIHPLHPLGLIHL